jgi:hypothetical protein
MWIAWGFIRRVRGLATGPSRDGCHELGVSPLGARAERSLGW